MTVGELLEGLAALPPDATVNVYEGEGDFITVWQNKRQIAEFEVGVPRRTVRYPSRPDE